MKKVPNLQGYSLQIVNFVTIYLDLSFGATTIPTASGTITWKVGKKIISQARDFNKSIAYNNSMGLAVVIT